MTDPPPRKGPVYPPTFVLLAIVVMIVLHVVMPIARVLHSPARYLGAIPLGVGVWLVFWVNDIFRRANTTIKPFEESSSLVENGPFRFSRNPIYLGMVLFLLGVAMILGTLTPFFVIPVFAILIDRRFVRAEEAMLTQRFGKQFEDYTHRVRRWM